MTGVVPCEAYPEIVSEVLGADRRIRPHVRRTYLEYSHVLSELISADVYLKLENLQTTGSFKLRGAFNRILSLNEEEASRGVVTASTGNHGLATAHALQETNRPGVIYLPDRVSPTKLRALRRYPVRLEFFGKESGEAELEARRVADVEGRVYVSPYNDPCVIGGQGTVGTEIAQQLPGVESVFVSVGGGGLIAGVGAYLKSLRPGIRLFGCLPFNSPVMYECVRAGKIIDVPCRQTLSDATAGAVEAGAVTFGPCRDLVDDWVLVSEEEIRESMRLMIHEHHMIVEGSAAVALASAVKRRLEIAGTKVAVVVCGGNVDSETVREVLSGSG